MLGALISAMVMPSLMIWSIATRAELRRPIRQDPTSYRLPCRARSICARSHNTSTIDEKS